MESNAMDFYCERGGPGLFAEPLNALTNLSFLIAAWRAWVLSRHLHLLTASVWLLIALLLSIGIGSTLHHTFATGLARLLDLVPILLFQLCFLWVYLRTVAGIGLGSAFISTLSYYAMLHYAQGFPHLLNGSLMYAPALIFLTGLGLFHYLQFKSQNFLLAATGVFILSLFFRTIDQAICPFVPTGTHFLWHVLNGVVLYLSLRALLFSRAESSAT
jgi:hypothetical protein